jgi:hypothetical protein
MADYANANPPYALDCGLCWPYIFYEVVIPRTPFIAFYRIDAAADLLTVVAFFHYAQDRKSEWGGDNGRGSCKGVPPA